MQHRQSKKKKSTKIYKNIVLLNLDLCKMASVVVVIRLIKQFNLVTTHVLKYTLVHSMLY